MRVFLRLPAGTTNLRAETIANADAVIVDRAGLDRHGAALLPRGLGRFDTAAHPTQHPHPEVPKRSGGLGAAPQDEGFGGTYEDRAKPIMLLARAGAVEPSTIEVDLAAIMPARPDAIVLPVRRGLDVAHLGGMLAVHEAEHGWPDGSTRIVAMLENASAVLDATNLVGASRRLTAIGWDADAIARDLGIGPSGGSTTSAVLAQVRATVRLIAAAAGVVAVETAYAGADAAAFRAHVAEARRDGFRAIVATDAAQIAIAKDIDHADPLR